MVCCVLNTPALYVLGRSDRDRSQAVVTDRFFIYHKEREYREKKRRRGGVVLVTAPGSALQRAQEKRERAAGADRKAIRDTRGESRQTKTAHTYAP